MMTEKNIIRNAQQVVKDAVDDNNNKKMNE